MNFAGTYTYKMNTPAGRKETIFQVRKTPEGYEGEALYDEGANTSPLKDIRIEGNAILFDCDIGPALHKSTIVLEDNQPSGHTEIHQTDGKVIPVDYAEKTFLPSVTKS